MNKVAVIIIIIIIIIKIIIFIIIMMMMIIIIMINVIWPFHTSDITFKTDQEIYTLLLFL